MCPLAQVILALAIGHAPPGRSLHSYEAEPSCGTEPRHPTCEIERVCDEPGPVCAAPRWSAPRHAWVHVESRDSAIRRYARIAEALAETATRLTSCKNSAGVVESNCQPENWPDSERSLAIAGLTAALHESGLREDVTYGYPPLGRGPLGEVCLLQVMTDQAPLYASWIPSSERARIAHNPVLRERFAQTLLGDSPQALSHCFEVGMRMLVRSRNACSLAKVPWAHGMFAMYGSGARCTLPRVADRRQRTFEKLSSERPSLDPEVNDLVGWNQCSMDSPVAASDELKTLLVNTAK